MVLFNLCCYLPCRYSLRGGGNGKLQHNPKSFLGLFNAITAMLTWMLRSKMQLTCMCHSHVVLNCLLPPSTIIPCDWIYSMYLRLNYISETLAFNFAEWHRVIHVTDLT